MSSFDKKLPNDLKRIWEASEQANTQTGPSTADAWMRLEQRLDMKDLTPARVKHRKNYFPFHFGFTFFVKEVAPSIRSSLLYTFFTLGSDRKVLNAGCSSIFSVALNTSLIDE